MKQILSALSLIALSATAQALPPQLDCQNQTHTTSYGVIKVRHVWGGGVLFTKMEIEKDSVSTSDWVDGPSGYLENNIRTYYGDNLVFTVLPTGEARLRLITLLPDKKHIDTFETYTCAPAQNQNVPSQY